LPSAKKSFCENWIFTHKNICFENQKKTFTSGKKNNFIPWRKDLHVKNIFIPKKNVCLRKKKLIQWFFCVKGKRSAQSSKYFSVKIELWQQHQNLWELNFHAKIFSLACITL
jgi:hypothetical protein